MHNEYGTASLSFILYFSPNVPSPSNSVGNRSQIAVVIVVVESTFLTRRKFWMAGSPSRSFIRPHTTKMTSLLDLLAYETLLVNCPSTVNDWPAGPCQDVDDSCSGILSKSRSPRLSCLASTILLPAILRLLVSLLFVNASRKAGPSASTLCAEAATVLEKQHVA